MFTHGSTMKTRQLEKLLDSYLSKDRYFYTVAFFLDRAVYAKLALRTRFQKEIEDVLDSLHTS